MIRLPLAEVARVVGGTLTGAADPDVAVSSVVVDSRAVLPGALFAAFPGEHADGANFAAEAVAAGAVAVLSTRPLPVPTVVVGADLGAGAAASAAAGSLPADTTASHTHALTAALGRLAHETLGRLAQVAVVGVTGSAGKTTTKDLIAGLLEAAGPTVAPVGSYNNDLGLPLTVLGVDEQTSYLVLEMGARGTGHIARLCSIAPPAVGVVLNVGTAHLGEFGSKEVVARAKGELVEAAGECAVLNADDPLVRAMRARAHAPVVTFGESPVADVRAEDVHLDAEGQARFRLVAAPGSAEVALQMVGGHQVVNALAAATVALHLGMGVGDVAAGLSRARPRSRWRMEVRTNEAGVTVVND
ncbi:MAG: UDP-N-acetylmuramoyl-tripeptide--D-alanyl-D-alanine ligase, partial [Frankiaceae bacterium]